MERYTENEIRSIVRQVLMQAQGEDEKAPEGNMTVPMEVSARHVHLDAKAAQALFGTEVLDRKRNLSQPGQFLSTQRVKLVTAKGELTNVAVLGPLRRQVQAELSATDCKALGISAPVNISGDLEGAGDILIVGPKGIYMAEKSVIIAKAHIHMTPDDARRYGVENGQRVSVRLFTRRPVTLEDVSVRVSPDYALMLHIDFDEANAAMADGSTVAQVLLSGTQVCAPVRTEPEKPDCEGGVWSRKLLTEADARALVCQQGSITVCPKTIITPAARDIFTQSRRTVHEKETGRVLV